MCFNKNIVDAFQQAGPAQQRLQQIHLGALDIDFQHSDVRVQVRKVPDKIQLPDVYPPPRTTFVLAGTTVLDTE